MCNQGNDRVRTRSERTEKARQTAAWQFAMEPASTHEEDGFDPIQLLEVAAHDLRNPISGILAAGQYLLEDAGYLLDEQHLALLQSIEASSRSMLLLIEDVIELSQIESGKLRLDIQSTDLQPLMNRALLQNQATADRKKVRLEVEADGGALLPPIDIDPVRIFHVIDSLMTHTIRLARAGSKIKIGIGSRAGKAIISLGTDGCGISAAALRSLFHPFRKGRCTTPGIQGGTALAFAKVKRIIEAHGGLMGVQSGDGKEWAIKVSLPLPQSGILKRAIAHKGAAGAP
jgi:signal transduction histidine kinase